MNTSKPNPHTITPTTVMESDFDEPTPHRKPGKSTGRPRSRHKHIYTEAWYVHCYTNQITGKTTLLYYPLRYCTVCGRIGGMQIAPLSGQNLLSVQKCFRNHHLAPALLILIISLFSKENEL